MVAKLMKSSEDKDWKIENSAGLVSTRWVLPYSQSPLDSNLGFTEAKPGVRQVWYQDSNIYIKVYSWTGGILRDEIDKALSCLVQGWGHTPESWLWLGWENKKHFPENLLNHKPTIYSQSLGNQNPCCYGLPKSLNQKFSLINWWQDLQASSRSRFECSGGHI